jgi:hypothetical protein
MRRQRALTVSEWKILLSEIGPQNAEITEQSDDGEEEVTSTIKTIKN